MRSLIDILDFSKDELRELMETAADIAEYPEKYREAAKYKKLATLFFEPSTRTRLSFEAAMLELLDIHPGAVSVMGLMNDRDGRVRLLIDEELLGCASVGCHPCVNTASLRLTTDDLLNRFLPEVGHAYRPVRLIGADPVT